MLVLLLPTVLIVLVLVLPCACIAHVLGLAHAGHGCAGEQKILHENQIQYKSVRSSHDSHVLCDAVRPRFKSSHVVALDV